MRELARRLNHDNDRGAIDQKTWARLAPLLPPPDLQPFTANDLPTQLLEPFTEKDGTRGRIVYIEATAGRSDGPALPVPLGGRVTAAPSCPTAAS